jgi:hypothetical protein
MANDTAVFDAVRLNIRTGSEVWTGRVGTPEAIRRDGLLIGGELRYCPHEWLDKRGYVDPELAQEHPNSRSLSEPKPTARPKEHRAQGALALRKPRRGITEASGGCSRLRERSLSLKPHTGVACSPQGTRGYTRLIRAIQPSEAPRCSASSLIVHPELSTKRL